MESGKQVVGLKCLCCLFKSSRRQFSDVDEVNKNFRVFNWNIFVCLRLRLHQLSSWFTFFVLKRQTNHGPQILIDTSPRWNILNRHACVDCWSEQLISQVFACKACRAVLIKSLSCKRWWWCYPIIMRMEIAFSFYVEFYFNDVQLSSTG